MDIQRVIDFIISLVVLLSNLKTVSAQECTKTGPCSCQFPDGQIIDLSPLASEDTENPRFRDVPGPKPIMEDDMFSWNPCTDFTQTGSCENVAVCHIHLSPPIAVYLPLGPTDTATFSTDDKGQLMLSYRYYFEGPPVIEREAHVVLHCDESQEGSFVPLGEQPEPGSKHFYFDLNTQYACYDGGDKSSQGLSDGTIVCIGFLSVGILYLVGGVMYNALYRKNTGVERLPNVTFWVMFPGLVKWFRSQTPMYGSASSRTCRNITQDGCRFVFTCGSKKPTSQNL